MASVRMVRAVASQMCTEADKLKLKGNNVNGATKAAARYEVAWKIKRTRECS